MDKQYTKQLANPFSTRSNKFFPKTIKQCFDWAQYMHDRFPVIGRAINKVVRYFAADVSISSQQDPDKVDHQKLNYMQKLIKTDYDMLEFLIQIGQELATMGNVFIYAMPVIKRNLCCPQCSHIAAIDNLTPKIDYQWEQGQFKGVCPKCGKKIVYKTVEKQTTDSRGRKLIFRCISARDMLLKYNQLTGEYTYLYKMPGHIKQAIVQGDPVYLRATPKVFLQGAFTNDFIMFPKDKFIHFRTDTLSTMDRFYKGWGTPLFLSSFNNVLRLAYLDKFNEAVATDFIAPVRLISPPPQALMAGQDQLRQPISGHAVKQFLFDAIKGVRENATQWVISPFAVNYQMLGGEAKQLAPVELMKWYQDRILQDMSIPLQLRQTSFQAVAQSMGLRMFERQWIHFSNNLEHALDWLVDRICQAHMTDKVRVTLDKTSFVQDDMHKQTILSMAGSGMLSNDTILKTLGLDFQEEKAKLDKEQVQNAEDSLKAMSTEQEIQMVSSVLPPAGSQGVGAAQFNMEQVQSANMPQDPAAAGGGAMPAGPGGAPPPTMPGAPGTPQGSGNSRSMALEQLYQEAEAKADQIFNIGVTQGSGARRSALVTLKAQNPELHAQVKQILQNKDQQTASQAVAQSKMPQG